MKVVQHISTRLIALIIPSMILLWTVGAERAGAQSVSLSGHFHVIWENAPPDATTGAVVEGGARYVLIDEQGRWHELLLDETLIEGGPLAFNRKRVKIAGERAGVSPEHALVSPQQSQTVQVQQMQFEQPAEAQAAALGAPFLAVTGAQPWVNLLCRFADAAEVTPHPVSWFETLMGTAYPGLDHYWQELSYGQVDLTGTAVAGWYDLPQPRSHYVYDRNGDGFEDLDFGRAVEDCIAVADADVVFPNFVGINLMFNQNLDCCAWGGSWTVTRDGQTRTYRTTWLPPWGYENQGVLGHEMGHGFGLPHSSGPYSDTYDSRWDVMSNIWDNCSPRHPEYGCIGVHTISYHKDLLGWIPSSRVYVATPDSSQSLIIERLGAPASGSTYQMAQIPIGGSMTEFYTVEARLFTGYDERIPGEAMVIHRVETTRGDRVAQVVDRDNNGDPNDAGAMWLPGETFTDVANAITVSVNATSPTGFTVTISSGAADLPDLAGMTVAKPPVDMKLGGSFPVTETVKNAGTVTAGASVTRYYLSLDSLKSSGDTRLTGSRSVPSLAPAAQSTGTVTLTIPTMTPLGAYLLLACADDTQIVGESREDNNCKASATKVTIQAPDFVETAVSKPPATAKRGGRFSVTDTAKNTGTAKAKASVTRYYLSLDPVKGNGDKLLTGSRSVPGLAPTVQSRGTVTLTIPTTTPLGAYHLLACADDTQIVGESKEGNNCKASATKVTIKP